jgi:hypothetical protein
VVATHIIIPFILVPQLLFSGILINFDRLNSVYRNPLYVPFIGEMMHARWAFEAIAVHQYKDNRFYRELFPIDQLRSNADYTANYLIPEIHARINEIENNHNLGLAVESPGKDGLLVERELQNLAKMGVVGFFGNVEQFTQGPYNQELFRSITDSLSRMRSLVNSEMQRAIRLKDAKSQELIQRWGGEVKYIWMKNHYTNERLEELVTNKLQSEKVIEWNDRLIRKMDPIHMEPLSKTGRAHFYAPHKNLGNLSIDTYWFNMLVIWVSSGIFYLTLVYDLLRKFTTWQQIRRMRRSRNSN